MDSELVNERGPTSITINHGNFTDDMLFQLYGLINISYCSFIGESVNIFIHRSQYEPVPTQENVRSFKTYLSDRRIKMYKAKLRVQFLQFIVYDNSQNIEIRHCDLSGDLFVKSFNRTKDVFIFISLLIDHGSISDSHVNLIFSAPTFSYIKINSVNMFNVVLVNGESASFHNLYVDLQNSTWTNKYYSFLDQFKVLSLSIISSELTRTCSACTLMTVNGHHKITADKTTEYFLKSIVENTRRPNVPTLFLIDNSFKAQGSLQDKITTSGIDVILTNNTFIIEGSVSFSVNSYFKIISLLIQCSAGQMGRRTLGQSDVIYTCDPVCDGDSRYSLQAGRLIISGTLSNYVGQDGLWSGTQETDTLQETYVPSCQSCPLGAKCENGIQGLANYWGYVTSNSSVSMARCPDGYCCQGNDTCGGIDSCNKGRTGILCGICEENLVESIFTPTCILKESCKSGLVITLFFTAALFYAFFLLSFSTIKNKLTHVLKKGYRICKERLKCNKDKAKDHTKQAVTEDGETDESGFKYIQILFYYVQD